MASRGSPQTTVSPKVTAATLASAVATLIWFLIGIFNILPEDTSTEAVAGATGATATVLAALFGYLVRDPLREQPPPDGEDR